VREEAAELGFDAETTYDLMLATTEAFANAVEHGKPCNARGILMSMDVEDGRVGVEIVDCGGCFPDVPRTNKPVGHGGRGLPIISAIVDDFEVVPEHETTRVRFQKRLAPA
jgi:serine/threonine-protein kinase RsbW